MCHILGMKRKLSRAECLLRQIPLPYALSGKPYINRTRKCEEMVRINIEVQKNHSVIRCQSRRRICKIIRIEIKTVANLENIDMGPDAYGLSVACLHAIPVMTGTRKRVQRATCN